MIGFTAPQWLFLLIPVVVGLLLSFRSVGGMRKGRKIAAFVIRGLVATLLIVALAGPQWRIQNSGICTIFVLDRSDSIPSAAQEKQREFVQKAISLLPNEDEAGIVVFGKEPQIEISSSKSPRFVRVTSKLAGSGSDIAAAIRLALAAFPEGKGKRIVLVSDGNETLGDAKEAAYMAAAEGARLDTVMVGPEGDYREATIGGLTVPSETRADQPIEPVVEVNANSPMRATIQLDRDGITVGTKTVDLTEGANRIPFEDRLANPGTFRYRATLTSTSDGDQRNNLGVGYVRVLGRPKVLLIQGEAADLSLANALRLQGVETDVVTGFQLPTRIEQVQSYAAILLNNINAERVLPKQMDLLRTVARDAGIGFGMIGGEDSFLPGGWFGTSVAEVLPIDMNVRQRKTFPSTAIAIVADMSGSMSMEEDGIPKYMLAIEAAKKTIDLLSPLDRVGVAGSTDMIEWVAPIQRLTNKDDVKRQVEQLGPGGGGIYIEPSLEFADENLSREDTKIRHLILLADGADCDTWGDSMTKVADMRKRKITTSVVAIGKGQYLGQLQNLAKLGGGNYYLAERASQLPAIFTQDAALMSRSAIEEFAFIPKVAFGDEMTRGLTENLPPLLGYCLVDSKPLSRVSMRSTKDDPLLVTGQYGLATTFAFMSDAKSQWAQKWVPWQGFGPFWAQVARTIATKVSDNRFQISTTQQNGLGKVQVLATNANGVSLNGADLQVQVGLPNGESAQIPLRQTAPGMYETEFDASEQGSYVVSVVEKGEGRDIVTSSGFSVAYPPEYRSVRPNPEFLGRLADTGGGKLVSQPENVIRPLENKGRTIKDIWAWFVGIAAWLFLVDISVRRLMVSWSDLFGLLQRKKTSRGTSTRAVRLEQLGAAKTKRTPKKDPATSNPGPILTETRQFGVTPPPVAPPPAEVKTSQSPAPSADASTTASKLLEAKRKKKAEKEDA